MEFRDLKRQYEKNRDSINISIQNVIDSASFIHGKEVVSLEKMLAEYVGVKHCITCANGTDALQLALMAWGVRDGDAVFVPDFTFFSSGEAVSAVGATPIFVDVNKDTFNMDPLELEHQIELVRSEKTLTPRVVIAVDLFGLPADYPAIRRICDRYDLKLLEDGAQGFGGAIGPKRACSFGDISTTSFFPAKPLGCYGDGGALFTDDDSWAELIRSLCVHGKGINKYDNVRIGMNSRLDTIQAAVLIAKFPVFINEELKLVQKLAQMYEKWLKEYVITPKVSDGFYSSWAQYTIRLHDCKERDGLQLYLTSKKVPSMIYYQKPMHKQIAFSECKCSDLHYKNSSDLSDTVLSLPFYPDMTEEEAESVVQIIVDFFKVLEGK